MADAVYKAKEGDEKVQTTLGGRFHALSLDDDDSEVEELDWEEIDRE